MTFPNYHPILLYLICKNNIYKKSQLERGEYSQQCQEKWGWGQVGAWGSGGTSLWNAWFSSHVAVHLKLVWNGIEGKLWLEKRKKSQMYCWVTFCILSKKSKNQMTAQVKSRFFLLLVVIYSSSFAILLRQFLFLVYDLIRGNAL